LPDNWIVAVNIFCRGKSGLH